MALGELMAGLAPVTGGPPPWASVAVGGLALDSRALAPGDAFFALPGAAQDGRDYLGEAAAAGAAAAVAEAGLSPGQRRHSGALPLVEIPGLAGHLGEIASRFFGHPSRRMHIAGVTGTNGKTTTSRLLAQLLRGWQGACGVIGTLGAALDDSVGEAVNTTPDAFSLHGTLADWLGRGVEWAVLEASSHALVQGRVGGIAFNTAIFTNLSQDHLDYHGDMANYGRAKSLLFQGENLETAILNGDDPFSASIPLGTGVRRIDYSLRGRPAALRASAITCRADGLQAQVESPWGKGLLHSPLAGEFNLGNLLAAIAAACAAGMDFAEALERAPELKGVPGRMQRVPNRRGLQLVVDYAHTPDALEGVLNALRAQTQGRLLCVFGCGGERDAAKRPLMGAIAGRLADVAIITSDNPRGEDPLGIIEAVHRGAQSRGMRAEMVLEPDRAAAIALALREAAPGDCVLVAGKGCEAYQHIGSERRPFSDVEALKRGLEGGP